MRARELVDAAVNATFVPSDPPRFGSVGLWPIEALASIDDAADLVVRSVDRFVEVDNTLMLESTDMAMVPLADFAVLAAESAEAGHGSPSWDALAAAVRHSLHLVARACVVPGLSASGLDAWNVGPLNDTDRSHLRAIAAAAPSESWAVRGAESATQAVLGLVNAVADTWLRTPAAPIAAGHQAFAAISPVIVDATVAVGRFDLTPERRPPLLVLRLMLPPPGTTDAPFVAALGLQSRSDSQRILDLEALWRAPQSLRQRFESIEMSLLVTLRRAARAWPPLERLLAQRRPDRIALTDDDVDDLLGPVGRDLTTAGLTVVIPSELGRSIDFTAIARSSPAPLGRTPRFDLSSVIELDWRAAIAGQQLTEAELTELAESKRSLVRFRGEWVRVDDRAVQRLREPRTVGVSTALAAALGAQVEVDGGMPMVVEGPLAAMADRLRDVEAGQELEAPIGLVGELRPYQRRGLGWLALMADLGLGGVLGDDMGLGKTIQVIALHLHRSGEARNDPEAIPGPMLVVCPASVVGNWEREIRRFAPELGIHRYHGNRRRLPDVAGTSDVVLTTYGVARRDAEPLSSVPWDLAIGDEAQAIKNPYSRTARAMRQLPANARFALTGTPVQNQLTDLWAIIDWSTPGLLGPLERFRRDFVSPIERDGDSDVSDHLNRLIRPFLLRRTKADPAIVPDLPPKTETNEIVPLTTEQAALYQAVVTEVMAEIAAAEGIERKGLVLRLITRLKQVCNHPEHFLQEGGDLAGRSGKLTAVTELLQTIRDESDAALLFTQYVAMAELLVPFLESQGYRTRFLHGGLSLTERERMVEEFQAGEADVFLLSLRAGGTGLNLTRATHVIHYDRWWNPAVEDQASDRAWRIGQDRPVQIHRMICEGTIEDRIASLLDEKRHLADAIVGSGEGWISDLTDEDLSALVSLSEDRDDDDAVDDEPADREVIR